MIELYSSTPTRKNEVKPQGSAFVPKAAMKSVFVGRKEKALVRDLPEPEFPGRKTGAASEPILVVKEMADVIQGLDEKEAFDQDNLFGWEGFAEAKTEVTEAEVETREEFTPELEIKKDEEGLNLEKAQEKVSGENKAKNFQVAGPQIRDSQTKTASPLKSARLSPIFLDYLTEYQKVLEAQENQGEQGLEVDGLALTVGKAYEKIRKVIDWKEENALRRGTIFRALKRHLLGQIYGLADAKQFNLEENAETMVMELLRTGYFDNSAISDQDIKTVEQILGKYVAILASQKNESGAGGGENAGKSKKPKRKDVKRQMKLQTWTLEIAACEIEECLAPAAEEAVDVELMVKVMQQRMRVEPPDVINEIDEKVQIELAARRALYNADNPSLVYQILKMRFPFWFKNEAAAEVARVIKEVEPIFEQTQLDLKDKNGAAFSSVTEKYDAAYRLIADIMKEIEPGTSLEQRKELFEDKTWVEEKIKAVYEARRKSLKGRLFRSAIWYTLSILAANGASVIAIEGPLAKILGYDFTWLSIVADLLLPSVIMFFLVIIIQPPAMSNYPVVENEVKKVIFAAVEQDVYVVKLKKKKTAAWLRWFFNGIYLACAGAALYFIYWALASCGLPPTSVYINVVYITMVFFAGLSVKKKSQEITIEEKGNFLEFVWDLFSVPLARIGSWFSNKWKEYNVVAILFSALIDTPFSALIGMISDWRDYLKERAAELK